MRLLKPKYLTCKEMWELMGASKYSMDEQRMMKAMVRAIRMCSPRPWWKRISIQFRKGSRPC